MRFLIHLLYLFLSVLLVGCTTSAEENPFEGLTFNQLKQVLETQKMTTCEEMVVNGKIGMSYNMSGKYDSARLYINKALNMPGGREFQGGRLITNLANSYGFEGRYVEALKYYMEALKESEQSAATKDGWLRKHENTLRVLANVAEIHYLTGNRKQALFCAERGKELYYNKIAPASRSTHYILPQVEYVIGVVYLENGEWDKAEKAMRETYLLADSLVRLGQLGEYMYAAYGQEGLARVSLARNDYDKALAHAAEALDYAGQHGDPTVTAKILSTFSDIYSAQGNYQESGRYAREAMSLFPDYPKLNPSVLFNFASSRLFAGDKEGAYEHFRLYSAQMKENTDKQFRETMASMEITYETEKKEIRISDLERKNIQYIIIGIACLILAISVSIILRQKIKNEKKEKQLIAANAILEWEKKERKRFASELHDGINGMLSAIKLELGTVKDLQNIRDRLDDCIETIRCMSRSRIPVSLERYGLKAALEDYCHLFPNVDFHFFGENKRLDEQLELTVYFCAYELINNAVKHSGAENINMELVQDGGLVSLTVQDDGCGFDKQSVVENFGLKNIYGRVAALSGKIDIVTSPGNGVEICIVLKEKA